VIEALTSDRANDALHIGVGQSRRLQLMALLRGESSVSRIRFTR
jgi:hypothetical protein